jgi:hypothetical protein
MNAPEWSRNNRQDSLQKWIEELNGEARNQFLRAGTHLEIFFIFSDEGLMEVVPIVGMDKDDIVRELRKIISERNGYAYIHIAEAAARHVDTADEADMLLVHAESRDGLSVAYCSTVVMQNEKKMLLDAVEVDGSSLAGRFAGIFQGLDTDNQ